MRLPDRLSHWMSLLVALACLGAACGLALHYPLSARWPLLGIALAAAAALRWWPRTPLLIALMPLIGFAPWTGWITFEEMDMLVPAVAAGGYAAVAFGRAGGERTSAWRRMLVFSGATRMLLVLLAVSLLIGLQRGLADAGGWQFGWYQGYHEPMNSVRAVKPFFLALLLLPLWVHTGALKPELLTRSLLLAMLLALAGIGGAALWERAANTGVLNFSTDYRTTALFWEMHVGGAALDGALALCMPFAVLALLRARTPGGFALLMALNLLGLYACLTTFSRGVYGAVPAGIVMLLLLRGLQRSRAVREPGMSMSALRAAPRGAKIGALLLIGGFVLAATTMFNGSGYRGLLALLGATFILLTMPASQWLPTRGQRIVGALMGALLATMATAACTALAIHVPKFAYVSFVLALVVALLLRRLNKPDHARPVQSCLLSAAWYWLLGCGVLVADSWGGAPARDAALPAVLALGMVWPLMLAVPQLWPFKTPGLPGWRQRGLLFSGLLVVAAAVATLGGGTYLRDRMSTVSGDMDTRLTHWREGLAFLQTPGDWLLGRGSGRYVATHFFAGPTQEHTGDYRLHDVDGRSYLVLTGGTHELGNGELFRITQRVRAPVGQVTLAARVRAQADVGLYFEICEKHLLYPGACMEKDVEVKANPGEWQWIKADLGMAPPMGGDWWAPRLIAFSFAVSSSGHAVDVDGLRLGDSQGEMLSNPNFSNGMAHWFFSSDRYHLPWHIKNLALHVLFEQGLLGLITLATLTLLALWRLSFGRGREQLLAPALAGALVGFVGVGAFDSLLDVPRVAYLFYVLLLFGLGLRAMPGQVAES